jgi:hypothetical protein
MRGLGELDMSTAMSSDLQARMHSPPLQKGWRAKCSTAALVRTRMFTPGPSGRNSSSTCRE